MNLGENIRKARKAAGVSQSELAERLQVHQKDISRWENGAHAYSIGILEISSPSTRTFRAILPVATPRSY